MRLCFAFGMPVLFIFIAAAVAIGISYFLYQLALDHHGGQFLEDYERRFRAGFPEAKPGEYFVASQEDDRIVFNEQRLDDDCVYSRVQAFGRDGRNLNPPPNPLSYELGAVLLFVFILSGGFSSDPPEAPSARSPSHFNMMR